MTFLCRTYTSLIFSSFFAMIARSAEANDNIHDSLMPTTEPSASAFAVPQTESSAPGDPAAKTPSEPNTAPSAPSKDDATNPPPPETAPTDCAIGLALWCFARTPRAATLPETKWRVEGNAGYKVSNLYYRHEIRGCEAAGCKLDFMGPSFAFGAFYNVKGHPHTDDYIDVGLAVSYMPIISEIANNTSGFAREYGRVDPGDGALAYIPVRIALRRPNFLYVIKSKYLVSEFGAGLAFPVTSGAGRSFTGGTGVKATVGGRLGVELPIADVLRVGVAGNWTVVWWGDLIDASFQTSYGLHLGYLL